MAPPPATRPGDRDDLLAGYRITQLELRATRIEEDSRNREHEQDKALGDLERSFETTIHRVEQDIKALQRALDALVVKIGIWATICGGLGMILMKALAERLMK